MGDCPYCDEPELTEAEKALQAVRINIRHKGMDLVETNLLILKNISELQATGGHAYLFDEIDFLVFFD